MTHHLHIPGQRPRPPLGAHEWLYHAESDADAAEAAAVIRAVGVAIAGDADVQLGAVQVSVPPVVYTVVRYERTPRSELLLRVEHKWADWGRLEPASRPAHGPHRRYSSEGPLSREDAGTLLRRIASSLGERAEIDLGAEVAHVGDPVRVRVCLERGPRGELTLGLEVKWLDSQSSTVVGTISDLLR